MGLVLFDWSLPLGRCVGVKLATGRYAWDAARAELQACCEISLVPAEWAFANALPPRRRFAWVAGRAAMRLALSYNGIDPVDAIGRDDRGAPVVPAGFAGSISHKEMWPPGDRIGDGEDDGGMVVAAALVSRETVARVGVDVEADRSLSRDVASRVLATDEAAEVASMDPETYRREVALRFSAKEALYKAIDPFVRRYVGFKEVAVASRPDGTVDVHWRLALGEGPFDSAALWRRIPGFVVTMARVVPKDSTPA